MENIKYSVVIRTIGKAGENYQKLLDSIANLDPQPQEVIVVLPEGYAEPEEKLGWETFYFSPKGMVAQRLFGIAKCKTPYALVCDDDVSFEPDFVRKLHRPIAEGLCGISAGPLYSFLPVKGAKSVISALSGASAPTVFHRDRYVSVLRTAGYSYNRHLYPEKQMYYEAQSLAWTCFYAETAALENIALSEERWLDANGYAAYDDQTMFYKAWLRGIKTMVVADAFYEHQDARTSTRNNKPIVLRCLALNRIIFWHRFIYSMERNSFGRAWAKLCFSYRLLWDKAWAHFYYFCKRYSKEDRHAVLQAHRDALAYIKSKEYASLPPVRKV